MTEDEAKTKWCPQIRFHVIGQTEYNNRQHEFEGNKLVSEDNVYCLASDCMCWVQDTDINTILEDEGYTEDMRNHGHCGLIK